MRVTAPFLVALVLALTPLHMQGQAHQQGAAIPDSSARINALTADTPSFLVSEPVGVPWLPPLEAFNGRWSAADSLPVLQPGPISTAGKVGIIAAIVIVVAGALLIVCLAGACA
jgi:hypothetical protein